MRKSKGNVLLLVLGLFVVVVLFSFALADTALRSVQTVSRDYEHEQVYIITKDVLKGFITKAKQDNSILKYIEGEACYSEDGKTNASTVVEFEDTTYTVDFEFYCTYDRNNDTFSIHTTATGRHGEVNESLQASFTRDVDSGNVGNEDVKDFADNVNNYIKNNINDSNMPSDAAAYTGYGLERWIFDKLSLYGSRLFNSTYNGSIYIRNLQFDMFNSVINGDLNFQTRISTLNLYSEYSGKNATSSVVTLTNYPNLKICEGNSCADVNLTGNSANDKKFKNTLLYINEMDYDNKTMEVVFNQEMIKVMQEVYEYSDIEQFIQDMFVRVINHQYWPNETVNGISFDNEEWQKIDEDSLFDNIPRIIDLSCYKGLFGIGYFPITLKLTDNFTGIIYGPLVNVVATGGENPIEIKGQIASYSFDFNYVDFSYTKFIAEGGADETYYFDGFQ